MKIMPPESEPVLDKKEALALCSGDEELFLELCVVFLTDARGLIERLSQALLAGDFETVGRHAHALKGISANICAGPLKESAKQLEMAGRNQEESQLTSLFQRVDGEFLRLQDFLLKLIPPDMR